MGSFAQFQRKRAKTSSSVEQSASVLPPSRSFAPPQAEPVSEPTAAGDWRTEVEHAARFGHSIARMAIHNPATVPQGVFAHSAGPSVGQNASLGNNISTVQRKEEGAGVAEAESDVFPTRENQTGLPDALKAGVETLSGLSLDDVQVHYNSAKPAEVEALAYTQGAEIHVGPGQEEHLAHEAWHVVQQKQGRVQPTLQARGLPINDDEGLEREADSAGRQAMQMKAVAHNENKREGSTGLVLSAPPLQFTLKDARAWVKANRDKTGYPKGWKKTPMAEEIGKYIEDDREGADELRAALDKDENVKREREDSSTSSGEELEEMDDKDEDEEIAPVKTRKQKASKAAVTRTIKAEQEEQDWDFATGHTSSGKWTKDTINRDARSFDEQRVAQVLRHLSTAVFHYVKSQVGEEQEVQAMYVNGRLFLSSNLPASMKKLKNLSSQEVFDIFLSDQYLPSSDVRALGNIHKLRALIGGERIDEIEFADDEEREELLSIKNIVTWAIQDPNTYIKHCNLSSASKCITDLDYADTIIIVEGLSPVHAEQNLILAYYESDTTEVGVIYGKKRPCTGCYLTFKYAQEVLGLNLVFNGNPGGFWNPAIAGLWKLIKAQKGQIKIEDVEEFVVQNLPKDTYRTQKGRGTGKGDEVKPRTDQKDVETAYDSPSNTEAEEMDLVLSDIE